MMLPSTLPSRIAPRTSRPWRPFTSRLWWVCLPLTLLGSPAIAEEPLISQLESYRVVEENGVEKTEPVDEASPGDLLEYRLLYTNVSERSLSGLVVTGPIPDNTAYVGNSNLASVEAEFTVNAAFDENFQREPYTRVITDANGEEKEVVVPPEDYTQIRWQPTTSIAPDQTQTYTYRVRVD